MEHRTIIFTRELTIKKAASFEYISECIDSVEKGEIVYINLSDIDRLDSNNLPLLLMLVYLLSQNIKQTIYLDAAQQHILDYLFSVHFFKLNYIRTRNISFNKNNYEYVILPIKKFIGKNGRADLLELARIKFQNDAEMKAVFQVLNNLSENCLDHTSLDPEMIDGFAYVECEDGWIKTIVMDFGEGFLESFKRRGTLNNEEDNERVVSDVLSKHRSSRGGRGSGIWAIENIVKEREGEMIVATGDSLAQFIPNQSIKLGTIPFFSGSLIYVKMLKRLDKI